MLYIDHMKIVKIFQIIILGIPSNLKEHLDGTFIGYSLAILMYDILHWSEIQDGHHNRIYFNTGLI